MSQRENNDVIDDDDFYKTPRAVQIFSYEWQSDEEPSSDLSRDAANSQAAVGTDHPAKTVQPISAVANVALKTPVSGTSYMSTTRAAECLATARVMAGGVLLHSAQTVGRTLAAFVPKQQQQRQGVFNHEALTRILCHESVKDVQVVVICVAGAFRSGKSLLLNFLLRYLNSLPSMPPVDQQVFYETKNGSPDHNHDNTWLGDATAAANDGFNWQLGCESHTEGIWAWSRAVRVHRGGKDYAVVLLDTQGTFDRKANTNETTTMFALSSILSSVLIYNIRGGHIGSDDLQKLHMFVEYGKRLSSFMSASDGGEATTTNAENRGAAAFNKASAPLDVRRPFQELVFLVRDWQNPSAYPFGQSYEYLSNALNIDNANGGKQYCKETYEVAQHLLGCFDKVDCYLLPNPGDCLTDPEFCGQLEEMGKKFRTHMPAFVKSVLDESITRSKRICANPVTCSNLAKFAVSCSATFANSGGNPNMPATSSWFSTYWLSVNKFAVETAVEVYEDYMLQQLTLKSTGRLSAEDFLTLHGHGVKEARKEFDRQDLVGVDSVKTECRNGFEKSLENRKERFTGLNAWRPEMRTAEEMRAQIAAEIEEEQSKKDEAAKKTWGGCSIL